MKKRPLFFAGTVFVLVLYLLLQWKEDLFYSAALAAEASFSDGDSVMFSGTVKSIENKEKQTVLTLRNAQIVVDNRSYESNGLLVYTEDIQACNPGEKISGYGKLNKIVKPENPGQFDARRYYNGKKVDYRIFSSEILEKNEKRDYYLCLLESIKGKLEAGIENVFGEKDAGILKSMLLGDKSGMDEETYAMFQLAGIAHVFAISGLHVALVGRGVYNLLRKTGLGFAGSFLISTILIISYGIMTGGSPSAIRAVIMFGLSVFAKVCGRSYDLLTAVMTALVFILIENPYAIQQSGVWLSFGAVLGIGIISPVFEKVIKPERALTKSFLVSYSVHLFTLPLVAVSFYQFSTYGILLNLIVIPLMTFVFLSGGAAGVCGIFLASLGHFIGGMAHYILLFYEKLCQFYIQIPGGIFVTGKPEKWQVILYYVLLLTILYGINLHRK